MALHLTASHDIDAPIDRVWAALSDVASYPDWNPFTPRVDGEVAEGQRIVLHVRLGLMPWKQQLAVVAVEAPNRLAWHVRGMPKSLLTGGREQRLVDLGDGRTRYETEERLEGPLSGLMGLLFSGAIQGGLDAVGPALAARVAAVS